MSGSGSFRDESNSKPTHYESNSTIGAKKLQITNCCRFLIMVIVSVLLVKCKIEYVVATAIETECTKGYIRYEAPPCSYPLDRSL